MKRDKWVERSHKKKESKEQRTFYKGYKNGLQEPLSFYYYIPDFKSEPAYTKGFELGEATRKARKLINLD